MAAMFRAWVTVKLETIWPAPTFRGPTRWTHDEAERDRAELAAELNVTASGVETFDDEE